MCCITARPQCVKGFLPVNPFISHIYICQKLPKMYLCVCVCVCVLHVHVCMCVFFLPKKCDIKQSRNGDATED